MTALRILMPISGAGAPTCDAGAANADTATRANLSAKVKGFIRRLPKMHIKSRLSERHVQPTLGIELKE